MKNHDHLIVRTHCSVPETNSNPYPLSIVHVVRDNDAIVAFDSRDEAEAYAAGRRIEEVRKNPPRYVVREYTTTQRGTSPLLLWMIRDTVDHKWCGVWDDSVVVNKECDRLNKEAAK